ncbi:hypothetical protein KIN20_036612 [Parelaphostrongylus tenuis]|uniref:Uncharacterized protein n=1 Tax=Parelaphostrongylus tenuis TaxID=148309 RepID=A0AAD5RGF8_PARTN|nr:hypothetical protein KIN20_036612 [Parelaphostrongylus tenuis]
MLRASDNGTAEQRIEIRAENGKRRKWQPHVSKCAQHADETRLSSDVWRPSDNGTAE